ncbi:MAG: four helix bundle protein, partial [Clostridia bacterium]|nr:four helix bundle protein [Clostridia bacterium]
MKNSKLREEAKNFAVEIIELCNDLPKTTHSSVLAKQIIRSSASIGANLYEANYAASSMDFINKLQISLKECYETEYWIELMQSTKLIDEEKGTLLLDKCNNLRRMLVSAVNKEK